MKEVYIISATRTPIGSFGGNLSTFSASQLGAFAIKSAVEKAKIAPSIIEEVFMGNVLSANIGQAPATQAVLFAGLGNIPSTTINKVCASGMKAIMLAAQSISNGDQKVMIAGGMESMSNVPHYLDKVRKGYTLGNGQVIDGLIKDGLWDVYNDFHMGNAGELCAKELNISREKQDEYAIKSYQKSQHAIKNNLFKEEIVPIKFKDKRGNEVLIAEDEEPAKVVFEKIQSLKPVFEKEGTITAANASNLNDGAAALVLISKKKCEELNLKPLAKIIAYADAQQNPEWFSTSPAKAIPLALKKANLSLSDISCFEINEAFSVVSIANNSILNINPAIVNINGGAVSLGHPLGASGARIVVTLIHVLKQKKEKFGLAAICNGGGGASALIIENIF